MVAIRFEVFAKRAWRCLTALLLAGFVTTLVVAPSSVSARSWWHRDTDAATLADVAVSDLPPEARRTLQVIRNGGPFPYPKDGIVFGNREKLLPYRPRGFYSEYTVRTPGQSSRGARRIVVGGDPRTSGMYYYSEDHYQSFKQIRE